MRLILILALLGTMAAATLQPVAASGNKAKASACCSVGGSCCSGEACCR